MILKVKQHKRVDQLSGTEQQIGMRIQLKKMPKGHRMKRFRLVRTELRALAAPRHAVPLVAQAPGVEP